MFKFSVGQGPKICWALVMLLFSALAVSNLRAQVNTADLSGTALDTTGAVIADATIQATNVNTGIINSAVTDGAGRYSLQEMPVGTYNVSAQKTGFQKMVQTGIILTVGAHPVLDFTLKVGHADEVVEVHGQASTVDTTTAAVGQLVSSTQMSNLPLNGRNFTDLLTLAPGVASVASGGGGGGTSSTAYGEQTNYSVSGSRPVGTAYMLDDLDVRDALDHGTGVGVIGTSLGMEAIQEFSILTNTYSAEFGGTGAAINMVTKSGTNDLHGSAYEYIRNSVLDAANWFDVPGQKPSFKRNQFGGSLGGAIKKDKAFYFMNYEGLRAGTGETMRGIVPTSLDNLYAAAGYVPDGSGGYVGGSETPYAGQEGSALTQQLFEEYPTAQSAAQCPDVTNTVYLPGTGAYCWKGNLIQNEDYGLGRVDYNFGPKDSAFARYSIENAFQNIPAVEATIPGWPEVDHERNQYISIEERHVFSAALLNELHFGVVRLNQQTVGGGLNGTDALHTVAGRQDMDWAPGEGLSDLGPPPSSPSHPVTNRFSVGDDVVLTKGAHSIHVGIVDTRVQTNANAVGYGGGWWDFLGLNGIPGVGGGSIQGSPFLGLNAAAPDFSYTTPTGTTYPFTSARYWRQNWVNPYFQDDWKISKRLTLNLGVRYEWASNPTTVGDPVFVLPNGLAPGTSETSFVAAQHPFASNPNAKNIDPRIGLAWDPFGDHKTAILAGFGMFHEPVTERTFGASFDPFTPLFQSYFPSYYPNLPGPNVAALINPYNPTAGITWYTALLNNVNTSPYVVQYNLTIQRELLPGTVFKIGYVGSAGVHEFSQIDANSPNYLSIDPNQAADLATGDYTLPGGGQPTGTGAPGTVNNPFVGTHVNGNFNGVDALVPISHSSYNSMQTSVTRQFASHLAGNAGYTWSKCLDMGSASTSQEQGEWAVYDAYNPKLDRGPCSYNSNQVFTANAIYSLPFHGNRLVSGWELSPIVTRYLGLPMNVQNMLFSYQSNIGGSVQGERPSAVPGCNPMTKKVHSQWWNPACFVEMPYGTIGSANRDSITNPGFFNADFSVMKNTKVTERINAEFRAEFFGVLNHPNFSLGQQAYLLSTTSTITANNPEYSQLSDPAAYEPPDQATGSAGGAICNPSGNPNAAVVGPCYVSTTAAQGALSNRQIQFALKLTF